MDVAHAALRQTLIAMDALDGNANAGWLFDHFGSEMTTVVGRCRHIYETQIATRHCLLNDAALAIPLRVMRLG